MIRYRINAQGMLLLFCLIGFGHVVEAAEVNGIYTEPTTRDLGTVHGIKGLEGVKIRGWVSTYYNTTLSYQPTKGAAANARAYNVQDNSLTMEMTELEIEKVPEFGQIGFKVDLAQGDTQDQIFDAIQAAHGTGSVTPTDRTIQHATVSYLAPIGRGLRFDFGKMVSHIGGETTEMVKNNNFSHTYFSNYGIPYQHVGLRLNYPWNDLLYTELYLVNGWNTTKDNDAGKSLGLSFGWSPGPISWYFNYLGGNESDRRTQPIGSQSSRLQLVDTQVLLSLGEWNFAYNFDLGRQADIPVGSIIKEVSWRGHTLSIRYKVTPNFEPSLRYEIYDDPDHFTVGTEGDYFKAATLTLNYRMGGPFTYLLVRPEIRWDGVNTPSGIFTDKDGNKKESQSTVGVNFIFYF